MTIEELWKLSVASVDDQKNALLDLERDDLVDIIRLLLAENLELNRNMADSAP